jgi:hypothetical protein
MNEGRAELQRVILQYEKQRAEAVRSRQECEIVLPFMRAALEELDAALGQSENGEVMERVQSQVRNGKARSQQVQAENLAAPVAEAPVAEAPVFAAPAAAPERPAFSVMDNTESEPEVAEAAPAADDAPAEAAFPSFNRASIASLIDQAGKEEKAR